MDLLSHVIWSYVLFRYQPWGTLGIAFCLVPDVIWAVPLIFTRLKLKLQNIAYDEPGDIQTRHLYRCAHSAVTMAFATVAVFLAFGPQSATGVLAGWTLHLLMDVWSHKGGIVNGVRVLYPLSDWRPPSLLWWREEVRAKPWLYLVNLAAAAAVYFLLPMK